MMGLTVQQARTLGFIREYTREHEVSPSFEEIRDHLGIEGRSGVHRIVKALEERGRIRRLPHRARAIEIINDADTLARVSDAALIAECKRRGL